MRASVVFRKGVRWGIAGIVALAALAAAHPALAQSRTDGDWRHGTTLGVLAGASTPGARTDALTGADMGWEVTPRFAVGARGFWLHSGEGVSQFAALLGPRISLRVARDVVPFLSAGVGMYRASFEQTSEAMPAFYRRRLAADATGGRTFQDVMFAVGAGAEVFLSTHVGLRPEATLQLVTTRSDTHAVPAYTIELAYHFESHHIVRIRR